MGGGIELAPLVTKLKVDINGFKNDMEKAKGVGANAAKSITDKMAGVADVGKSFNKVGSALTKYITTPALTATTALVGITLVKGFNRLTGIDDAKAKLKALGHEAEDVQEIMESALESVKGTSFGLDDAATQAANAVAAGVKPGKDLTKYLTRTADAAAIAGTSMGEMGGVFNKAQTSQKVYAEELNQLADKGIPIYQWLADEIGKPVDQVKKLASEGKVSSEMFFTAIDKNIGGAAKVMGENSFKAMIDNVWASIGRIGANFLDAGGKGEGFFTKLKPYIAEFPQKLAALEEKAAEWGAKLGDIFVMIVEKVQQWKTAYDNMSPTQQNLITSIGVFMVALGPLLSGVGKIITLFSTIAPIVSGAVSAFGVAGGGMAGLGAGITALLGPVGIAIAGVAAFAFAVSTNFCGARDMVLSVMESIRSIITSVMEIIRTIWDNDLLAIRTIATNVWEMIKVIFKTAFDIISSVFKIFAALFKGDWATVWEEVKNIVNTIWEAVKSLVKLALDTIIQTLLSIVNTIWEAAKTVFTSMWNGMKAVWESVTGWFSGAINDPVGTLKGIGESLGSTAKAVFTLLWDGFKKIWENTISWLGGVVSDPVEKIKGIGNDLWNAGWDAFSNLWEGMKGVWGSIKGWVERKAAEVARMLNPFNWFGGGGGGRSDGYNYNGLSYVPFDGYNAVLHKGERVLTAEENRNYIQGRGSSSGGDTFNFYSNKALDEREAARLVRRSQRLKVVSV